MVCLLLSQNILEETLRITFKKLLAKLSEKNMLEFLKYEFEVLKSESNVSKPGFCVHGKISRGTWMAVEVSCIAIC